MRIKTKYVILLSLLCSLTFAFFSCSKYDDMADGNTGGNGDPKIHGEKTNGKDIEHQSDSIVNPKGFSIPDDDNIPDDGNTGGSGDPKSN